MIALGLLFVRLLCDRFKPRRQLEAEILALRWNAKQAAKQDTEEDAKCQGSGGKPGDPAYDQCRAQLDAARTQAAKAADEFARKCSGDSTLPPCPN